MSFGSIEAAAIYFNLLGGEITSGQLDTQLSNALLLGKFRHLIAVNNSEYKSILINDSVALPILNGSSVWQSNFVINSAIFFDINTKGAFLQKFSTNSWFVGGSSASTTIDGNCAVPDLFNSRSFIKTNRYDSAELSTFGSTTKTWAVSAATVGSYYLSGTGVYSGSYGYIAGGRPSATSYQNQVYRIAFNSATVVASTALNTGRYGLHGSQHGDYGFWFTGVDSSSPYNAIDRVSKITHTTNAQTALSNASIGYQIYGVGKYNGSAYLINGIGGGNASRVVSYNMTNFTEAVPSASTAFSGACAAIEGNDNIIRIQRDSSAESYTYAAATNTFAAAGNAPASLSLNNSGVSCGAF